MKSFKGKAIRNPSGKAGEYGYWSYGIYKGCPNGCTYCYLCKGVLAHAMGGKKAELKKCFINEDQAIEITKKEILKNLESLQKHGLFFTFISDPFLKNTIESTIKIVLFSVEHNIPVKLLSKRTDYVDYFIKTIEEKCPDKKHLIAVGYTLTGKDNEEPFASPNIKRIEAMEKLYNVGFRTFASIEPIIEIKSSIIMIASSNHCCELFKIGLMSGGKYTKLELQCFIETTNEKIDTKIYWKDTLLQQAGINREDLPNNCVTRDYNLFQ